MCLANISYIYSYTGTYTFLTSMLTSWLRSSQCSSEWGGSNIGSFCLCTQNSSAFSNMSAIWSVAAISEICKKLPFCKYINHSLVWQKFPKEEKVQLIELIMSALRSDYFKSMTLDLSLSLLLTSILANTDAVALMTLGAQPQAVMFYPSLCCKYGSHFSALLSVAHFCLSQESASTETGDKAHGEAINLGLWGTDSKIASIWLAVKGYNKTAFLSKWQHAASLSLSILYIET